MINIDSKQIKLQIWDTVGVITEDLFILYGADTACKIGLASSDKFVDMPELRQAKSLSDPSPGHITEVLQEHSWCMISPGVLNIGKASSAISVLSFSAQYIVSAGGKLLITWQAGWRMQGNMPIQT